MNKGKTEYSLSFPLFSTACIRDSLAPRSCHCCIMYLVGRLFSYQMVCASIGLGIHLGIHLDRLDADWPINFMHSNFVILTVLKYFNFGGFEL